MNLTREDLEQRIQNLEAAEHEAIFSLGRATGQKEAMQQILAEFFAAEADDEDNDPE